MALGLVTTDGSPAGVGEDGGLPASSCMTSSQAGIPLDDLTAATEAVRAGRPVVIGNSAEYQRRYSDNADLMALTGRRGVGELAADVWRQADWRARHDVDAAADRWMPRSWRTSRRSPPWSGRAWCARRCMPTSTRGPRCCRPRCCPSEPADVADLDVAVTYEPADAEHGLGGDWYDVMALPKQRAYLAVGDVVGHGLPAVEDMAQLRSAGRAMALQGLPPAQLLAELNTFTAHASHGRFATMAVAVFDPQAGALYVRSGRPSAGIASSLARRESHPTRRRPRPSAWTYPRRHLHRRPGAARAGRRPGHVHRRPYRGPRLGHRDRYLARRSS